MQATVSDPASQRAAPIAHDPIGRRMTTASLTMVATRLILRGIGFFSTLVLVRLLAPADFGLVGLASAVYAILDTLTITGFGLAIIRMEAPARVHYDTAWTMNLIRGLIIAAGLLLTARLQARLMGDPRITPLMWLLAGTALVSSLESVRLVDCQRAMRFDAIMRYNIAGKIAGFCIVVPLAFVMRNYWPLLLSGFFGRLLVEIPYSYVLAPYRPRLSLGAWRELFHFSKWLALGNICTVLDMQLMNFVLGRMVGLASVGLFQVAYQVAALPVSEIAAPIRAPVYAGFARIHRDADALRRLFLKGLELQWLVILPLSVGIAVTAPEITAIFLGPQWGAAVALLPPIALYGLLDAIGHYTHNLFIVMNRQRAYTLTFYASLLVRLPATIWATASWGFRGAVLAMLVTAALNMVIWLAQAKTLLRMRLAGIAAALWRGAIAGGALAAGCLLLRRVLPPGTAAEDALLRLGAEMAAGGITYVTALVALWFAAGAPGEGGEALLLKGGGRLAAQLAGRLALLPRRAT